MCLQSQSIRYPLFRCIMIATTSIALKNTIYYYETLFMRTPKGLITTLSQSVSSSSKFVHLCLLLYLSLIFLVQYLISSYSI